MEKKEYVTPDYIMPEEMKRIRKKLDITQKELAELIHCSKSTVERWEMSEEPIKGPVVLLLKLLEKHPEYVEEIRVPEKVCPVRLWYMHNQDVCTLIEVDEASRQVHIKNYTEKLMFRAFGVNEKPDYEAYLEFLESRCFPRSRDKMKLILKDLDLPFYDPFLIIEKTEGKMAEDNFWIKIER